MKLYHHPVSTTSRTIMLFAAESGIPLEMQVVDLFTGEHMQAALCGINPNRLVPVLEDGDFVLTENSAILKYLADKTGSPAYPKDLQQRARVNERMDWTNTQLCSDLVYGLVYPQIFDSHKRRSDEAQAATLERGQGARADLAAGAEREHPRPGQQLPVRRRDHDRRLPRRVVRRAGRGDRQRPRRLSRTSQRWLGRMKALKSWPQVYAVFDGYAASLKGKPMVAV